jgi:TonB family protein
MPGESSFEMKTPQILRFMLLLAIAASPVIGPAATPMGGLEPLRIVSQRDEPLFPFELIQLGVREGMARIAFSVDANGRMDDCLAVAYTHPEFARASIVALKRWKFEPARYRGEPVATSTEVVVSFEVQGTVVVSMTPSDSVAALLNSMMRDASAYRARLLSELDRIPTPLVVTSPRYPVALARLGRAGKVTVQFYIDETGAVRLPSVNSNSDPELSAAAVQAVQQWRFESPTWRGQRVLVKAEQVFDFKPLADSDSSASGRKTG